MELVVGTEVRGERFPARLSPPFPREVKKKSEKVKNEEHIGNFVILKKKYRGQIMPRDFYTNFVCGPVKLMGRLTPQPKRQKNKSGVSKTFSGISRN